MKQVILKNCPSHPHLLNEVFDVVKEDKDFYTVDLTNKNVITGQPIFKAYKRRFETMKKITTALLVLATLTTATTQAQAPAAQATHCKGITKTGAPCRSIMVNKTTGFCRAHDPAAKHCTFIKKNGQQCQMIVKANETLCRFHNF